MEQMFFKWRPVYIQVETIGRTCHSELCAALWVAECSGIPALAAEKRLKFTSPLTDRPLAAFDGGGELPHFRIILELKAMHLIRLASDHILVRGELTSWTPEVAVTRNTIYVGALPGSPR